MSDARNRWLAAAVDRLRPWFAELGKPLPKIYVAATFNCAPAPAVAGRPILGLCRMPHPEDASALISIAPRLDSAMSVLCVLLHECVHAAVGAHDTSEHGKRFSRLSTRLGLWSGRAPGHRRVEYLTPLRHRLERLAVDLGEYPPSETPLAPRPVAAQQLVFAFLYDGCAYSRRRGVADLTSAPIGLFD